MGSGCPAALWVFLALVPYDALGAPTARSGSLIPWLFESTWVTVAYIVVHLPLRSSGKSSA
eukprot:3532681-Pyramimonas_sp.AAC.1